MNAPTWAVIPSDGRPYLADCLSSLSGQVDGIVVVANGPLRESGVPGTVTVEDTGTDRNISRWWNLGLAAVEHEAQRVRAPRWNALVVNDDIIAPPNLAISLAAALRSTGAALAYPSQHDNEARLHTEAAPVPLEHRITGYAWMLRGETQLRADETLVWWYGDDDLDWRARTAGGAALVPGCAVEHRAPNGYTTAFPELAGQAGRDRATFITKWQQAPH
ncbi:glycosyltransferase family 2 protein [Streptomyces iconiensis]|uniref:Glycosyltransferase n=1 Tax=Streptomyces iconiensis TaxID=1384038 RepID=A0ABT7A9A6_9ACTN|nr:hypothetical protein [Streptomyces iconiensis]MDJ1137910.1 hypothetical protein [Streptomyces iconiensis]